MGIPDATTVINLQMPTLQQQILDLIQAQPALTDRQITDQISGKDESQQAINGMARMFERGQHLRRMKRPDGLIGNYPIDLQPVKTQSTPVESAPRTSVADGLSEDQVKKSLEVWLNKTGWQTRIAWAKEHGTDIRASQGSKRREIEVKGGGSRPELRVNYFWGILGETLRRMEDVEAKYSIALPDLEQFRHLWDGLPTLAKRRTGITALFVGPDGTVTEVAH